MHLRAQLRTLADEARGRELAMQEYLSNWRRADEEATSLRAALAEAGRQARDAAKMLEALRRKAERDAKALESVVAQHGAVLEAAERLFCFEGMRAMAGEEFGRVGEAIRELLRVVRAQKAHTKGH